jgi:hypothetical protein
MCIYSPRAFSQAASNKIKIINDMVLIVMRDVKGGVERKLLRLMTQNR